MEQFIKKLVSFIRFGLENNENFDTIQNTIDLLEHILDSCEEQNEKIRIQNLMNKCNLTKTILSFLCSKDITKVIYIKMINLCINLLDGGNTYVQTSFFDYFVNTPNSENFFSSFYQVINDEINFINKKKSFNESISICLKDLKYSYQTESRSNITAYLRLLQLLTENHNATLQVFYLKNFIFFYYQKLKLK